MDKKNKILLWIAVAFASAWIFSLPANAQFSETWEFYNALEERDYAEMRARIFKGANIDAYNKDGLPAVLIAADDGDLELLRFLADQGANLNRAEESRGETPLMRRAQLGDAEFVRVLLELGADPNLQDRGGETALIKAANARSWRVIDLLLEGGADPLHSDFTGRTALDYARDARDRRSIRILEEAGG